MIAVVAEKPSVARDLAAVLGATQRGEGTLTGNGYVVTWGIGHLVGLAEPEGIEARWARWRRDELPMLPNHWPLTVLESTRDQFAVVRRVLTDRRVESVVCATDAGREGELIFRLIYEASGCRLPVRRLWISSLTPAAIAEGFKRLRPSSDFDRLADAAIGRSRADWLVGMNLSRAYGLALDAPLSVGRVQTPTLALLVERELAIRSFVPEDYKEVLATFSPREGCSYQGIWHRPGDLPHPRRLPADGVEAAAVVARALSGKAQIASVTSQQKKLPPPQLYDLTELQRHCNRLYGFSAQRTLETAQALYEQHKLLSYPRTDSRHLSSEVAKGLPEVVEAIRAPFAALLKPGTGQAPLSRRFVDDARVTDHHAIIPTQVSAAGRSLSSDEQKVYGLVCRRLLQAWQDDFVWAATEVVTEITSTVVDTYRSHGTAIEQLGWKALDVGEARPPREKGSEAELDEGMLPAGLVRGQPQTVLEAVALAKRTRPPPRLNDATLLTAMETAGKTLDEKELSDAMKDSGLGTPATRASIIETLLSRGYVARDGKALNATERGIGLIAVVDSEVKSAAMTGEWEARLQNIARGQGALAEFMKRVEEYVSAVVGRVPPRLPPLGGGGPPPGPRSFGAPRAAVAARSASVSPRYIPSVGPSGPESRDPANLALPLRSGLVGSLDPGLRPTLGMKVGLSRAELSQAPSVAGLQGPSAGVMGSGPKQLSLAPAQGRALAVHPEQRPAGLKSSGGSLNSLLHDRFGFSSFRPHQEAVCVAAAAGKDVLLVMPTGAGKSLCYQLPGIARGGTTLVISPLIALMEDQVARLQSLGFRAERIHSGRARSQSNRVCAQYIAGELDYLFVAPERLGVAGFPELLARRPLSLVAIDEAHCISQWGHDFRPDYRLLGERLPSLRPAPVVALTATATPIVQKDIVAQLGLGSSAKLFIHGFRRDNLAVEAIEVLPGERPARARAWLRGPGRLPAIVYAPTRKLAEAVSEALSSDHRVRAYHAGLTPEVRDSVQTAFLGGELDVVVATIAFGMGIDKADIRTVLHLGLPGSIESYYQEIGRAGRDGKPSRAVLMHHFVDRKTHEFFLERDYPDASILEKLSRALKEAPQDAETVRKKGRIKVDDFEKALEKLWIHGGVRGVTEDQLVRGTDEWQVPYAAQRRRREEQLALIARFAEGHGCRMLALVRHFGDQEDSGAPCGQCDVCAPKECVGAKFETPTADEQRILSSILARVRSLPGQATGRLCRELLGEDPTARRRFERLLGGLQRAGMIRVADDAFEKDGKQIAFTRLFPAPGNGAVTLTTPLAPVARVTREKGGRRSKKGARRPSVSLEGGANAPLVASLRAWRLEEARRRRVPAFRILTNRALVAVAQARPSTPQALLAVSGIGAKVVEAYGPALISLCCRPE